MANCSISFQIGSASHTLSFVLPISLQFLLMWSFWQCQYLWDSFILLAQSFSSFMVMLPSLYSSGFISIEFLKRWQHQYFHNLLFFLLTSSIFDWSHAKLFASAVNVLQNYMHILCYSFFPGCSHDFPCML